MAESAREPVRADFVSPLFILSLPRSGSTLLQRMLATHREVATTGEPWLLLPLLYAIRRDGAIAEYNHGSQVRALQAFIDQLPNGIGDYRSEVAALARRLYAKASPPGTRFFLEKSPPYHFVVDELFELFPDARFVFLWRNPLAVAASVTEMWGNGRWSLNQWRRQMEVGFPNLIDSFERHESEAIAVRYEDLVAHPTETITKVFAYCDLSPSDAAVDRFGEVEIRGKGDLKRDSFGGEITESRIDAWIGRYGNPLRRRWGRAYLDEIGDRRLELIGYPRSRLLQLLDSEPSTSDGMIGDAGVLAFDAARLIVERWFWAASSRRRLYRRLRAPGETAGRLISRLKRS